MAKFKKCVWQLVETNQTVEVPDSIPPIDPNFRLTQERAIKPSSLVLGPPPQLHSAPNPLQECVPTSAPEDPAFQVLDHPHLGGKITVCVLLYGDFFDLAKRCLDSILESVPSRRLDLRVALNQPGNKTLDYVEGFNDGVITKIYLDTGERRKYPAMRAMFHDSQCPITTKYLCWFDDDSFAMDKLWLPQLARDIVANHPQGCRLYGTKFTHDLAPYTKKGDPLSWFRAASWWKNRPLFADRAAQREIPNGSHILFVTGGFWALCTETIREADIPDVRLNHNGGDCTIGEQVHQAGYKVKDFTRGKRPIAWSAAKRRGYHEEFPWSNG